MTVAYITGSFLLCGCLFAWGCYWKSRFHGAKAEVYQEFADTFHRMGPMIGGPRERKRAEAKRLYMSLALCDPLVRDGLHDALMEAEEHWGRFSWDEPREWPLTSGAAEGHREPRG